MAKTLWWHRQFPPSLQCLLILSISYLDIKLIPHPHPLAFIPLFPTKKGAVLSLREENLDTPFSSKFPTAFCQKKEKKNQKCGGVCKTLWEIAGVTLTNQSISSTFSLWCRAGPLSLWNHHVILHALHPGLKFNPAVLLKVLHQSPITEKCPYITAKKSLHLIYPCLPTLSVLITLQLT